MPTSNHQILVVDDNPSVRLSICAALRSARYLLSEASTVAQARHQVLAASQDGVPFDLLLLDIQMPPLNGQRLFEELTELDPCPPLLLMTAELDIAQAALVKDDHCVGLLWKPFDRAVLLDSVAHSFAVLSGRCPRPRLVLPGASRPGSMAA